MKTKAQTLLFLSEKIKKSKVLPLLIFKANTSIDEMVLKIKNQFSGNIIVRSSSHDEDTNSSSKAGYYKSILNVDTTNTSNIKKAVEEVIISFDDNNLYQNEILIQPMLNNVITSGVAFTCDISTLSPYYIVNYDMSSNTTSVTDGHGKELKTYVEYKYLSEEKHRNTFLNHLIDSIKELEEILDNKFLDIEFGYDGSDIYIFQARNIVKENKYNLSDINLGKALFKLHKKIKKLNKPHPNLLGDYTIFGVMSDWNPAEIIGKKPKFLSLSLYKELITNSIWAHQRDNYGYRDLKSHPLLVSFLGIAYIDIRVSFNSFIPKELDDHLGSKLVNYYLNILKENPKNHDKIEFDVILTCLDFSINKKLTKLLEFGFLEEEIIQIKSSLEKLTQKVFTLYKDDLKQIDILENKYNEIVSSELSIIDKIYWLTENCKIYGTLPFAGLARSSFISMSLLKSLVDREVFSKEELSAFLNSLKTVSKQLIRDLNIMSKKDFLDKYGHLRPGTYEITSKRYDENYEEYFSQWILNNEEEERFLLKENHLEQIDKLLLEHNLFIDAKTLMEFIKDTIEAREYSKFIFTKSLSKILCLIEELGNKFSIKKEDMAYVDFNTILSLYSTLSFEDLEPLLKSEIEKNKKLYTITQGIKLPDLLINEDEVYSFFNLETSANFITLKSIESEVIKEEDILKKDLKGKIVCIKAADPGYDFLFTKNIGGLITCYGGANSHMAIRCAELNIPAVIGVGQVLYNDISSFSYMNLDCSSQKLKKIR